MRQLPRALPFFGAHLENSTYSFISLQMFLEIIMKSERKVENTRSIQGEDLFFFFREHRDFGRKKGKTKSKLFFFFREHQFLKILVSGP